MDETTNNEVMEVNGADNNSTLQAIFTIVKYLGYGGGAIYTVKTAKEDIRKLIIYLKAEKKRKLAKKETGGEAE